MGNRSDDEITDLDIVNLVTDCFYDPDGFMANRAFRPVRNASKPPQVGPADASSNYADNRVGVLFKCCIFNQALFTKYAAFIFLAFCVKIR